MPVQSVKFLKYRKPPYDGMEIVMSKYEVLSEPLKIRIERENAAGSFPRLACDSRDAIRRNEAPTERASAWKSAFVKDIDKILDCPFYNRYADKTQVFPLYKNDDLSRRSIHVQLVSRIARTIGGALHLNPDLIEAIALGHDIGHPPFAHAGEKFLDELFFRHTGKHFSHPIHSVRVLDQIYPCNLTLQTLNGIASHNVKLQPGALYPVKLDSFAEFDSQIGGCYVDTALRTHMAPATLEGYVVRITDIIAYIGRDREDATRAHFVDQDQFSGDVIGVSNDEIVNNTVVNIIENSYGKPYLKMDDRHMEALLASRTENYAKIYNDATAAARFDLSVEPMMYELYERLLDDLITRRTDSPIFTHHIAYINHTRCDRKVPYEQTEPNQLVVDYIASMTDDYFIDLHHHLFPNSPYRVKYKGYFD